MLSLRTVLVFLFCLFFAACTEEPDTPEARFEQLGQQTYRSVCLACHQGDGQGIPSVYPPIVETEWVEGDTGRLIRLVLNGMEGPVEVKGTTYNGRMQGFRYLSDEQIAAVLTFVRQNFGNDAPAVDPEEVSQVRLYNERERPWHPDSLWRETGIPADSANAVEAASLLED